MHTDAAMTAKGLPTSVDECLGVLERHTDSRELLRMVVDAHRDNLPIQAELAAIGHFLLTLREGCFEVLAVRQTPTPWEDRLR